MMFLISGNCKAVVFLLLRILEKGKWGDEEVQSLRLQIVDMLEKKELLDHTVEKLLKSLADRKLFFLSLKLGVLRAPSIVGYSH